MKNEMELGSRIALLRKEKNTTQNQLAEKLGVSFQAISCWERNETMPDIDKLLSVSRTFNVSTDYLLGKQEDVVQLNTNKLFDEEKIFTYLKGYSNSKNMRETQVSIHHQ